MKRCRTTDKERNDEIYEDNLEKMDFPRKEDPFKGVSDYVLKMASCLEDIADIKCIDPSIALGLMSVIPLILLEKRHTPEVFNLILSNNIRMSKIDIGLLLRTIASLLVEDGDTLPDSISIQFIKKDEMPTDMDELIKSKGYATDRDFKKNNLRAKFGGNVESVHIK